MLSISFCRLLSGSALLLIVVIGAMVLAGCQSGSPQAPVEVITAFDTSASFRPHLPESARLMMHVVSRLKPGTDRIALFRVDDDCQQFFDGPSPISSDEIAPVLIKQLKPQPERDGTYPAAFFESAASQAGSADVCAIVCYVSDGDIDGHLDTQVPRLRKAADRLAKNRNVKAVCLVGVSPSNWARWRSIFAPLGDRLIMTPASAMTNGCLDQALQHAGR